MPFGPSASGGCRTVMLKFTGFQSKALEGYCESGGVSHGPPICNTAYAGQSASGQLFICPASSREMAMS